MAVYAYSVSAPARTREPCGASTETTFPAPGVTLCVVLANFEVADKLGVCLSSFDSYGRHFSVVLTAAFVVVRSSQNYITLQGSHYYQATVGLKVAVNITQGVRDDGLSRKPTSADSIIGTSAAPHKGIFGAIPSALACALARPD